MHITTGGNVLKSDIPTALKHRLHLHLPPCPRHGGKNPNDAVRSAGYLLTWNKHPP